MQRKLLSPEQFTLFTRINLCMTFTLCGNTTGATAGECVCVCVCPHTLGMNWALQVPDFPLAWDEASLEGVFTHVDSRIARKTSLAAQKRKNTKEEARHQL